MADQKAATVDTQRLLSYLLTSILNQNSTQTWQGLQDLIYNAGLEEELKGDATLCIKLQRAYVEVNRVGDAVAREKILQSDEEVFTFLQRLDAKVMHPPMMKSQQVSLELWKVLLGVPRVDSIPGQVHMASSNSSPPQSLSSSQVSMVEPSPTKKMG